ncbi:XOO1806 family protein [Lysobacter sp. A3-1-A15]|uniref:XOO1806 family protein n=1 Tax=Novilysobacter viscosus TaxID=3098602 RepID=UPI002EDB4271
MNTRSLQLPLALLLAFGLAGGAHAQSGGSARADSTVLPVWNKASGNLEAVLLLEPAPAAGGRWRLGRNLIDVNLGGSGADSLGLVCDRKTGLAGAIGNLANHCMLASLDPSRARSGSGQLSAGASIGRNGNRIGVSVGEGRDSLPAWLSPSGRSAQLDQNTLTVYGQKNIGREATVSIGGTWARARLIPAGEVPDAVSTHFNDRWNTQSVTVGADIGDFGASIIGRVIDTPQQEGQWEGLGLGLTWRTPWSGQLTVGAENVVTRGKNPFAPNSGDKEEGTVPYVRYEQDL